MSSLRHHPLGQPVPNSVHAVCCSLPTMADVIGYEEKHPETLQAVKFAYPRFVFHDYVRRVMHYLHQRHAGQGRLLYVLVSQRAAQRMARWMNLADVVIGQDLGITFVHFPESQENAGKAKAFLQHTGLCISSRQAEDFLVHHGVLDEASGGGFDAEHPWQLLQQALQPYLAQAEPLLATSGMNAFLAALEGVRQAQRPRARRYYIQLGWLYLDTQEVLKKFLAEDETVVVIHDVGDLDALETFLEEHPGEVAALITEVPTNPLVQVPDVKRLAGLAQQHGFLRILDPSLCGLVNLDLLPWADVLVCSLTKYAAHAGDVMAGLVAINPNCAQAGAIRKGLAEAIERPYRRDAARLCEQLATMPEVANRVNANTRGVIEFLEAHPQVRRIYHPMTCKNAAFFGQVARHPEALGSIITLELKLPLADFYDRARLVKGPSFGTSFTMMCPFLYLAHYELVTSPRGRAHLQSCGLDPELIRLSVGSEPLPEIIDALNESLSTA